MVELQLLRSQAAIIATFILKALQPQNVFLIVSANDAGHSLLAIDLATPLTRVIALRCPTQFLQDDVLDSMRPVVKTILARVVRSPCGTPTGVEALVNWLATVMALGILKHVTLDFLRPGGFITFVKEE